mgnify:CR=1 FL=1
MKWKALVIGSVTIDEIDDRIRCGGPALYSSLAFWVLGWEPYIAGTIGEDFPVVFPFEGTFYRLEKTIRFQHHYLDYGARISRILYHPEKRIRVNVNPKEFDAIVINPVFDEFDHEWLETVLASAENVCIDIQGFVRRKGNDNIVEMIDPPKHIIEKIINRALVVKASNDDLRSKDAKYGKIFLLTLGRKGSITYWNNNEFYVPTIPVDVQPTGAGDAFLAAFITCYIETRDIRYCSIRANAVTSYLLEKRYLDFTGFCIGKEFVEKLHNKIEKTREQIEERISIISDILSSFSNT